MSSMTKWEYRIVRTKRENVMSMGQLAVAKTDEELKGHTLDSAFSILGEQGWELCGSTGPIIRMLQPYPWFVFKRPKLESRN